MGPVLPPDDSAWGGGHERKACIGSARPQLTLQSSNAVLDVSKATSERVNNRQTENRVSSRGGSAGPAAGQ